MSDHSFDGDSPVHEDPVVLSDSEADGDVVAPRRRGPGRRQRAAAAAAAGVSSIGPPMIFFILACASGLWASDFQEMQGLETAWADGSYGDGACHFVGMVFGHWEFTAGAADTASTDETIFIDLASVNGRGRFGFFVYRALQQYKVFGDPVIVEPSITAFQLFQRCSGFVLRLWDGTQHKQVGMSLISTIRSLKQQRGVSSFPMHVVSFCPQAAIMTISGWKVFHAVAVSAAHRGTAVILS